MFAGLSEEHYRGRGSRRTKKRTARRPPLVAIPVRLCGPGGRFTPTHDVAAGPLVPPLDGGSSAVVIAGRTNKKRGRRPAPLHAPVREPQVNRQAPPHRALRFSEAPPPHRGALSVARGVSGGGGWLIHHPSTVDCRTSPRRPSAVAEGREGVRRRCPTARRGTRSSPRQLPAGRVRAEVVPVLVVGVAVVAGDHPGRAGDPLVTGPAIVPRGASTSRPVPATDAMATTSSRANP